MAGTAESRRNLITSIYLEPDGLEAHVRKLEAKYRRAEREAVQFEDWRTDRCGNRAGGLRYCVARAEAGGGAGPRARPGAGAAAAHHACIRSPQRAARAQPPARLFLVVELSTGQLVEDVRLALEGRVPVEFYSRVGGNVPSAEEVLRVGRHIASRRRQPRGGSVHG